MYLVLKWTLPLDSGGFGDIITGVISSCWQSMGVGVVIRNNIAKMAASLFVGVAADVW